MNALLLLLAMLIAGSLALSDYEEVKDMGPDDEDAKQLLNIITKSREPKSYNNMVHETPSGQLRSYFHWNDCGSSSDVAHLQSLSISPDPLSLPGNITVGFQWQTTADLQSPISMELKIQKKIGFLWVTVPCHMIPGSCYHDNICMALGPVTCPKDYQACHCPFKQGTYTFAPTAIDIPNGGIPSGDYRITFWLKQGNTEFSCTRVQMAVA